MAFGRLKVNTSRQTTVTAIDVHVPSANAQEHKSNNNKRLISLLVGASCTGLVILIAGAIFIWMAMSRGWLTTGSNSTQVLNESLRKRTAMAVVRQTEVVTPAESVDYALMVDASGHSSLVTLASRHGNISAGTLSPVYCDPRIQFKCDDINCVHIKLKCNKRRDCPKGEDEDNCTCVDYLNSVSPQKICDGFPDCPSFEDELKCDFNCAFDEFRCLINGNCIKNDHLCDDVDDCPDGADEKQCCNEWSLAPSIETLLDRESFQIYEYGFLFGRRKGVWHPVCGDTKFSDTLSADFCTKTGFKFLMFNVVKKYPPASSLTNFLHVKSSNFESKPLSTITDTSSTCASGNVVWIACDAYLNCDSTPFCKPPTKRIVGGGSTGPFCHPWSVALYRDGELTCQAVVLTNRWLLTAAHCFTESFSRRWTARMGFYRQYSQSPMEEVRQVQRVVVHPNYTSSPLETNDLALIKLDIPVKFGYHIRPPCLPTSADDRPANGEQCTVVGWGFTDEKSSQTVDELQSVQLTVTDSSECNSTGEFKGKITDGHLCLNHGSDKKDACQGDSGGPLLCRRTPDNQLYLAGVTSTGYGCARPTVPSIWTRLGYYLGWIRSVLENQTSATGQSVQNPACQGFGCKYGDCVYRYFQCDHQWNCLMDGQDEMNCYKNRSACESPLVRCNADHTCIPSYKLCDYVVDCSDGEDEKFCGCDSTDNTCPNGGCAPSFYQTSLKFSLNSSIIDKFC